MRTRRQILDDRHRLPRDVTDAEIHSALARHPWPHAPTPMYAHRLAVDLGVDPIEGCWEEQCEDTRRIGLVERIIERATTGSPALAAYEMCRIKRSSPLWGRKVIEDGLTTDKAIAARLMRRSGMATAEWAARMGDTARDHGDKPMIDMNTVISLKAQASQQQQEADDIERILRREWALCGVPPPEPYGCSGEHDFMHRMMQSRTVSLTPQIVEALTALRDTKLERVRMAVSTLNDHGIHYMPKPGDPR